VEAVRVIVYVVGAGWVELHYGLVLVPEQGFDLTHLLPSRASLDLLKAAVADRYADMLPSGADSARMLAVCGDDKKAVWPGGDEESAVGVAVVGLVAGGLDAEVVGEVHVVVFLRSRQSSL